MFGRNLPIVVTLGVLFAAGAAAQLPPPTLWEQRTRQDGSRYYEAIWNHTHWLQDADLADRERTILLGLNLLFAPDEIPGLSAFPGDLNGLHTWVSVGKVSGFRRTYCTPDVRSVQIGELVQFYPDRQLDLAIELFPSVDSARASLQAIHRSRLRNYESRTVSPSEADKRPTLNSGLPSGSKLGTAFVVCPDDSPAPLIAFQAGRALVRVTTTGEADLQLAEAVAWGISYRLQHHPELVGDSMPSARSDGTVDLNGVKTGALTLLREVGCQVQEDRQVHPWTRQARILLSKSPLPVVAAGAMCTRWKCRVAWGQRWVELEAFSWQMKTWDGRTVRLSRPAFPYKGQLVAPLEEVKQALGLTVQAQ